MVQQAVEYCILEEKGATMCFQKSQFYYIKSKHTQSLHRVTLVARIKRRS